MTLWDSKERGGRPDVVKLIKDAYYSWGAEVVFITSNWMGNKEMMEGCKEAGIPALVRSSTCIRRALADERLQQGTLWDF